MIASLPMYDIPALRADHDTLWKTLRQELELHGIDAPATLSRDESVLDADNHHEFLFTQTCRTPFRTHLRGLVHLVGTPDYALPGCRPGFYRSAIVVRRNEVSACIKDICGLRMAVNSFGSWSGWESVMKLTGKWNIEPGEVIMTGSHQGSACAVADGRADFAAIDQVTMKLSIKHDPSSPFGKLRVIHWTDESPGLPYVASKRVDARTVFMATWQAIASMPAYCRSRLGVRGLVRIPEWHYLRA